MSYFKKALSMLLVLTMVLAMAPVVALAASGIEFTVGTPDEAAAPGGYIEVPVSVTQNSGMFAFEFTLDYDPDVLTLMDMTAEGASLTGNTVQANPAESFFLWSVNSPSTGTGEVVNCTFMVNSDVRDGDYDISLKDVYVYDANGEDVYDADVVPGTVTVNSYVGMPFESITYYDEEMGEEVPAPIRLDGEYSYAGGYAVVPRYVITLPYGYEEYVTLWFREVTTFQPTYADESGQMDGVNSYPFGETETSDSFDIYFTLNDYFFPQFGSGWTFTPEYAITWEVDPNTVPIPEWEPTADDIVFTPGWSTNNPINVLENGVFQVNKPGQSFELVYSVMNMPAEYEVKDFEWKYTDPRGTVKTDTEGNGILISDLFAKDYGMGEVQLTVNFWPLTHDESEIKTVVKTAPFYYGTISTTLDKAEAEMKIGEELTLTATHTIEGATIAWDSSDKNVATVVNGVVTAVGSGTANITATANGKTATCAVTVAAPVNVSDCKVVARYHVKDENGNYCYEADGKTPVYAYNEVTESIILRNNGYVDGSPWRNSATLFVMDKDGKILTNVEWALESIEDFIEDTTNNAGPGGFILNTNCHKTASTTLTATLSDGSTISVQARAVNYAADIVYSSAMANYYNNASEMYWAAVPGDTLTPVYSLTYGGGALSEEDAANNTIEWRSTDEAVAKFENGKYSFGEGTAEIYGVIVGSVDGKRTELEGERIKVYVGAEYPQNGKLVYADGSDVSKTYTTSTEANAYKYARATVAVGGKTVVKLVGVPETSTANVVVKTVESKDADKLSVSHEGNTITLSGIAKSGGESPVEVYINWRKNVGDISQNMGMDFYVDVYECGHTELADVRYDAKGDGTHDVISICKCGHETTENAVCADNSPNDGICDLCFSIVEVIVVPEHGEDVSYDAETGVIEVPAPVVSDDGVEEAVSFELKANAVVRWYYDPDLVTLVSNDESAIAAKAATAWIDAQSVTVTPKAAAAGQEVEITAVDPANENNKQTFKVAVAAEENDPYAGAKLVMNVGDTYYEVGEELVLKKRPGSNEQYDGSVPFDTSARLSVMLADGTIAEGLTCAAWNLSSTDCADFTSHSYNSDGSHSPSCTYWNKNYTTLSQSVSGTAGETILTVSLPNGERITTKVIVRDYASYLDVSDGNGFVHSEVGNMKTAGKYFTSNSTNKQYVMALSVGDTVTVSGTAKDEAYKAVENSDIELKSSDESIVKVEGMTLKVVGEGEATVRPVVKGENHAGSVAYEASFDHSYVLKIYSDGSRHQYIAFTDMEGNEIANEYVPNQSTGIKAAKVTVEVGETEQYKIKVVPEATKNSVTLKTLNSEYVDAGFDSSTDTITLTAKKASASPVAVQFSVSVSGYEASMITKTLYVEVPCNHEGTEVTTTKKFNGIDTHTVTQTCECGHVIKTETVSCVDEDEDGFCDVCDGMVELIVVPAIDDERIIYNEEFKTIKVPALTEEGDCVYFELYANAVIDWMYTATDGFEVVSLDEMTYDELTGGFNLRAESVAVALTKAEVNQKIEIYVLEPEHKVHYQTYTIEVVELCEHEGADLIGERIEGTETHELYLYCFDCEEIIEVPGMAEDCGDNDGDGLCDVCGGAIACKHTETKPVCEPNGDGTHTTTVSCTNANCGKVVEEIVGNCESAENNGVCDSCGGPVAIRINEMHADLTAPESVQAGQAVAVELSVENDADAEDVFNSYKFIVSYDAANLSFVDAVCADADFDCRLENGKLVIDGFGKEKFVSETAFVTLNFTAGAADSVVKIEEAYASTAAQAITEDIDKLAIEIEDEEGVAITIAEPAPEQVTVSFAGEHAKVMVNDREMTAITVEKDSVVKFTVVPETGYVVTGVSHGTAVEGEENTYSFTATENTEITISCEAETYAVEVNKTGTGAELVDVVKSAEKATFGQDYGFSVTKPGEIETLTVSVSVEGKDNVVCQQSGDSYTIKAEDVVGKITINVNAVKKEDSGDPDDPDDPTEKYVYVNLYKNDVLEGGANYTKTNNRIDITGYELLKITYNKTNGDDIKGEGFTTVAEEEKTYLVIPDAKIEAGETLKVYLGQIYNVTLDNGTPEDESDDHVNGNPTANYGSDYVFTIDEGHTLGTVTVGGAEVTPTFNEETGEYTIGGGDITGEIVITTVAIEYVKSVEAFAYVEVEEAIENTARTIWLVVAKGTENLDTESDALGYDGSKMFWSEKYEGFAWLIIKDGDIGEEAVEAEALTKIAKMDGVATPIDYTGDVNMSGNKDINDAQLTYDFYNGHHNSFDAADMMQKMLRADMTGDKELNVDDATAVVGVVRP